MSMETAREAAARGAAFLDEKDPGWRGRINVVELDLREPCGCIVGQDFGDRYAVAHDAAVVVTEELTDPYVFGLRELGIDDYDDVRRWDTETALGFVASEMEAGVAGGTSWSELQIAWRELLEVPA